METSLWDFLLEANSVPSLTRLGLLLLLLAVVMWPLEQLFPAYPQGTLRRPGTRTDLIYWFFTPVCTKVLTSFFLIAVTVGLVWLLGWRLDARILEGFGPLGQQPGWLQAVEMLIVGDFLDYSSHRMFHTSKLWRFHAVHHSPEHMDWLAYGRMHPVNDAGTRLIQVLPLMLLGFSPIAVMGVLPFLALYVIFLHSNISWTFGPFRYVLVSPAYHRWHHAKDDDAVDVNFAGIFPIWDLLFGTFYMPRDRLPKQYGVRKEVMPTSFWGQMLFPFRKIRYRESAHRVQDTV
jgi:sterol desaturase/sphingolipid hydroxylase (fatty acid hydroxylase superfamily)